MSALSSFMFRKVCRFLPDRLFILFRYRLVFGCFPDVRNPRRFTEVVQWTKLYDRNPLYHTLVDKVEVKEYVASKIGRQYVVPTLGVWDRVEDIDWESLPEQFVIKCTHDSGSTIVCKDKSEFDFDKASSRLRISLGRNFYMQSREWVYKGLEPRIIAEKYLCDNPTDYKFYCFSGKPAWIYIVTDRGKDTRFDFFDMDFNHLDVRNIYYPNADAPPERPVCFEQMKKLSAILSKGIPQVRVDFYEIEGRVYFGELTFCQGGGFEPFDPEAADLELGSYFLNNFSRITDRQ